MSCERRELIFFMQIGQKAPFEGVGKQILKCFATKNKYFSDYI